jgi:hypothetical protein
MADKFPRPYVNEVPKEGGDPCMEYVDFDRLGIGARNSGVPKSVSDGPKPIEHVGTSTGGGRK